LQDIDITEDVKNDDLQALAENAPDCRKLVTNLLQDEASEDFGKLPRGSRFNDKLNDELLTVKEAAAQLKLCKSTVSKLCFTGRLNHIRIMNSIRIPKSELEAFIEASRNGEKVSGVEEE